MTRMAKKVNRREWRRSFRSTLLDGGLIPGTPPTDGRASGSDEEHSGVFVEIPGMSSVYDVSKTTPTMKLSAVSPPWWSKCIRDLIYEKSKGILILLENVVCLAIAYTVILEQKYYPLISDVNE